jgi:hypothetical protein
MYDPSAPAPATNNRKPYNHYAAPLIDSHSCKWKDWGRVKRGNV